MGRFSEGNGDSEYAALDFGRYEHNVRAALNGKRGQKALKLLLWALETMPNKRLIYGWLATPDGSCCTVGLYVAATVAKKSGIDLEDAVKIVALDYKPDWSNTFHDEDGWHEVYDEGTPYQWASGDQDDGESLTVDAGMNAGLVQTLAYELGYLNDCEINHKHTPEERYEKVLQWVRRRIHTTGTTTDMETEQ